MKRLQARVLTSWSPAIEDAVRQLPEGDLCPRDLYLSLIRLNFACGGEVAVVESDGSPMAVLALQREGRLRWANAMNWLLPGFVGAVADGYALESHAALRREIALVWLGMPGAPEHSSIREVTRRGVHALALSEREKFWGGSSHGRSVRRAKRQCAHLSLRTNGPGDPEWIIRSVERKFHAESAHRPPSFSSQAKFEISRHLVPLERQRTVVLLDGDRPVAGSLGYVSGDTYFGWNFYRDESIGNLPTGVHLMAASFDDAESCGCTTMNIGISYPYKDRWAPVAEDSFRLVVATGPASLALRARKYVQASPAVASVTGRRRQEEKQGVAR